MNWDQLEGQWKQMRGKVQEKWGELTNDDLDVIKGKRDNLIGRLQERYGYTKDVAEREAESFFSALDPRRGQTAHTR